MPAAGGTLGNTAKKRIKKPIRLFYLTEVTSNSFNSVLEPVVISHKSLIKAKETTTYLTRLILW